MTLKKNEPLLSGNLIREAAKESLKKLSPKAQAKNPVMLIVYLGSIFTGALFISDLLHGTAARQTSFLGWLTVWLWFTVLFANFAESLAEGRAKAQANALRGLKTATPACRIPSKPDLWNDTTEGIIVDATQLRKGDIVLVKAGEIIPCDGEVVRGIASVNESAITGESAPVVRESGGDFSSVTGGTTVLSDWIVVRVESDPGDSFIDRMIAMVEGAARKRTPNEVALTILLLALSVLFLIVVAVMLPASVYSVNANGTGEVVTPAMLIALLVCLTPTTIGGLLSAIGIAGMSRLMSANVIARSGRAVEAAGDVDVLLLDKTGTITFGNRRASAFHPAPGITVEALREAALLSSLADDTPEGKSIVELALKEEPSLSSLGAAEDATFIPFTAQSRMSGVNLGSRQIRKGATDAVVRWAKDTGHAVVPQLKRQADAVSSRGATALMVAENGSPLGVIELKDIVKPGIAQRFAELREMGIKTIMVTGDNPLTAAAIAAEAGVDDFVAEATPESKLRFIRDQQANGHLVAMNSGTQAAKDAANMVDLDSSPTKLIDIVRIGKQMLMTRGALTTFSLANDVAKYFAIIPAAFSSTYPSLSVLNVTGLETPESAMLSAVIFNALIIVALIPIALKGVHYKAWSAARLLKHNLLVYGLGGVIIPFAGIKLIDMVINVF
ncbi:potassium-transporting ATPase subunit KdpB [Sutterella wadsworthensis]|uniref:potassium-transporting ATPase subunit KdpB n=1 Tax=Sutterella wadsworthensis TaxID=40545 RepID=UPI003A91E679